MTTATDSTVRVVSSHALTRCTTTFTGPDRAAVLEAALAFYRDADAWLRDPSYPSTFLAADGQWQACVTVWNA